VFTRLDGISFAEGDRPVYLSTTATRPDARFRQMDGRKDITLLFHTDFDHRLSCALKDSFSWERRHAVQWINALHWIVLHASRAAGRCYAVGVEGGDHADITTVANRLVLS
jgi:hypothetical protein